MDEFEEALGRGKNQKATRQDGFNAELFKYGGILLKLRLLNSYNICWKRYQVPLGCLVSRVVFIFKKGKGYDCNNDRGNVLYILDTQYMQGS